MHKPGSITINALCEHIQMASFIFGLIFLSDICMWFEE